MGFLKTITTPHGITAEYHNIARFEIDFREKKARVIIESFISQELRRDGKLHVASFEASWRQEYFPFTDDDGIRKQIYAQLKQRPEWADAEDC